MVPRRVALALALAALASGCKKPLALTVSYAAPGPASTLGSVAAPGPVVRTTDPAAVARVVSVVEHARTTSPLVRCTFLEGGEPPGLRFELSDGRRVYLRPLAPMVTTEGGCHATTTQPDLEALATALGVKGP